MNISIYVNKELAKKITDLSRTLKRTRNSVINEALENWVKKQNKSEWPKHFFEFEALSDFPSSKELRKGLKITKKDPLA